jgi:hypothetical protein
MFAFGGALLNVLAFAIADKQFRFVSRPAKRMTRQQNPMKPFVPVPSTIGTRPQGFTFHFPNFQPEQKMLIQCHE